LQRRAALCPIARRPTLIDWKSRFFADNFNHLPGGFARNATGLGNLQHAHNYLTIGAPHGYHVAGFHGVRRFRSLPVKKDEPGGAEILGHRAARAKTT